jgi:ATP-dependent helicase/nuclease subunit A
LTGQVIDYAVEDERTRERIRGSLGETLFVEAGAGTGKTSALVDRVLALVLSGVPIERIVAITFTERAAAELRDRVRAGLEEAREAIFGQTEVIDTALSSLDRAQVSTIHSFCERLLHSFAAEAGIDPSFRVQDEVLAERRQRERWRVYLEDLAGDQEAVEKIDRALGLGLATRDLESLATELTRRPDLAGLLENAPLSAAPVTWPDLRGRLPDLSLLPLDAAPPEDELRQRVERLITLVGELVRLEKAEREPALAARAETLERSYYNPRGAGAWLSKSDRDTVSQTAGDIADDLNETLSQCRAEALADVLPLIVRFVRGDEEIRGREGTLTFDDLILRVRDLLAGNPEAVASLRGRYDVMLVDEFQDTDPLQVEIAMSFATDPVSGSIDPGRLFLVGDPKQSIYRFRRADMAVYSYTRDRIEEKGGAFPELALNRRSRPTILKWVNEVFESLIGPGYEETVQPEYRAIHPARVGTIAGPSVAWIGGEEQGKNAREVREVEARAIASHCLAVIEEGWQVAERDGMARPASLKDIAVLIPARTVLPALERALADASVPYRVESGSLIYRTQEVRDLLNCLTAIDDPADEVAVVAALRSPAYACSDVELASYKAAGGHWDYLSSRVEEAEGRVADGLRDLRSWHKIRHEGSLAALIDHFVAERGQVEVGILDAGNRNSFRRTRFVVEQARAFESAGPESLRAFVAWMERRAGEAILDNEGAGLDDDEDAVRVITIHGAKGLEFPIVFVAGLGSAPFNRPGAYLVDRISGEIAVCAGTKGQNRRFELGPFHRLSDKESAHLNAEYARLLYVAATRARDHLVVSLYHKKRASQNCGAKLLLLHGADRHAERRPDLPSVESRAVRPFDDLDVDAQEEITRDVFDETRRRLVIEATKRRYTSATAIGQIRAENDDQTEPWSHGRGGSRRGRAVHAAIQSLPLDADDAKIAAFSRAQAVAEAVPHLAGEVERLVRWVLRSSSAAERARHAPRAMREVPFAVASDGTVLEGFIDLVIESENGIEIVDWKTDQITAQDVNTRMGEYRTQAGLYVYGLEAATGRRVTAVTYVFASAQVEVPAGDPAALSKAAQEAAMRLLTPQ